MYVPFFVLWSFSSNRFGVARMGDHRTFWIVGNLDPMPTYVITQKPCQLLTTPLTLPASPPMVPPASAISVEGADETGTTQPSLTRWAVSFSPTLDNDAPEGHGARPLS